MTINIESILVLVFFVIFNFGCVKQNQKMQENKFLFDAVDLLGKKASEIDGVLGKPYKIVSGKSTAYPTTKNHWRWYQYEKDLGVFIDEDNERFATSVTLTFKTDPEDAKEAASMLGIDLSRQKPSRSNTGDGWTDERYDKLQIRGKKIVVYYFNHSKNEDTIKVFFDK